MTTRCRRLTAWPPDATELGSLRAAIEVERARTVDQITSLERSFAGIVEAAELTSTDDEHDPEGATIAYERAQVSALLRQARDDLDALDDSLDRIAGGTVWTCAVCGGPIALGAPARVAGHADLHPLRAT